MTSSPGWLSDTELGHEICPARSVGFCGALPTVYVHASMGRLQGRGKPSMHLWPTCHAQVLGGDRAFAVAFTWELGLRLAAFKTRLYLEPSH
eukprot:4567394-Amphidinium_carterae.1